MWYELFDATSWIGERLALGSLQGAVVIALAWATCRWIPRVPAALQAWVWWLVAIKLVIALLPLPVVSLAVLEPSPVGTNAVAFDSPDSPSIAPAVPVRIESLDWIGLLSSAWLLGIALHGLLLVRAAVAARGLIRRATPLASSDLAPVSQMAAALGLARPPRVRRSCEISVPQVVGVRNPVVLVPADATHYTAPEWQMALAHELMHVRRHDVLLGCVPALAERLYFFHPLVRLAAREYVMAREAACDAAVVRALDLPADDYGRLLVRLGVARSESALVASSASASVSCLRRRLDMLQHPSSKTSSRLMAACLVATAALLLAPVQVVAQRPPALPALPAQPAPPAPPAPESRALPPAPPVAPVARVAQPAVPAPPAPPLAPGAAAFGPPSPPAVPAAPAPPAQVAPVAPVPPVAPAPPPPPSSDEVVIRLKSPATETEAVNSALFFLQTQLAQVDDQAGRAVRLTVDDRAELAQVRRKLEELVRLVESQARAAGQNDQAPSTRLAQEMAELDRQREALVQQQRDLERQIGGVNAALERMKKELRSAEEAAKKR